MNHFGKVAIWAGSTTLWVKPENFEKTMLLAKRATRIPTAKQFRASVMRKADKRSYPHFVPGMTTEQYVEAYWELNGGSLGLACSYNHRTNTRLPLEGEVQRLINGFYELPLGTTPQELPLFDGVEEAL